MSEKLKPQIHEYLNYRIFLKDMYSFLKKSSPGFSYRNFSRAAGLRSSNFLKLVMDGKRNLGTENIHRFAKALKLTREENHFFEVLVHFAQASSAEEKNLYYDRIARSKKYTDIRPLEVQQYAYFSHWHFVALRELVSLQNFQEDPGWINRKLRLKLHPEEIKKAIRILLELGLLERNAQGRLQQSVQKITTTPEMGALTVVNFHREMIRKASESLESSSAPQRNISALTIGISKRQFEKIRDRLDQFRREIHAISSEEDPKECVYQLNLQFFNLSEVPWNVSTPSTLKK